MEQLQRVVADLERRAERVSGTALRSGLGPAATATANRLAVAVLADAAVVALDAAGVGLDDLTRRLVAIQARVRLALRVREEFAAEPDEDTVWN